MYTTFDLKSCCFGIITRSGLRGYRLGSWKMRVRTIFDSVWWKAIGFCRLILVPEREAFVSAFQTKRFAKNEYWKKKEITFSIMANSIIAVKLASFAAPPPAYTSVCSVVFAVVAIDRPESIDVPKKNRLSSWKDSERIVRKRFDAIHITAVA